VSAGTPSTASRLALRSAALGYLALLVGLPVGYLFIKAFAPGLGSVWHSITQPDAVSALELSLKIAVVVVPVNTVAGVLAAILLVRHRVVGRRLLDLGFDVPVAVSPVIIGVALFLAYAPRIGWFGPWLAARGIQAVFSPLGIALASLAVSLPYVLRSVAPLLAEVGDTAEQASRTLGASPWRTFRSVTLPSIRWGVLYGATLTLARTLGEFGAVLIVSGNIEGRTQTMPIWIYDAWDQNYDVNGAFAGAAVLAMVSVTVLIALALLRRRERRIRVDIA
jgi:sulfate transport system permease protein